MGLQFNASGYDPSIVNNTIESLSGIFKFSVIELLPLVVVVILLVRKSPPIMALLAGTFMGVAVAFFRQGESIQALLGYLYDGYSVDSGLTYIDKLLNRGGIMSMISSFLIVFSAAAITGMLSESGILGALVKPMANNCEGSRFKTVFYTLIIGYTTNMIGSSMLLAEIVPGTIMKPIFKKNKLAPENLSRLLEDSGTLGAWLIPWNANAIFGATMLGASVASFVPFCLLSWISPLFSLFYAATGLTMKPLIEEEEVERAIAGE
jgi:NhaC family Na+:H+ antiporter